MSQYYFVIRELVFFFAAIPVSEIIVALRSAISMRGHSIKLLILPASVVTFYPILSRRSACTSRSVNLGMASPLILVCDELE